MHLNWQILKNNRLYIFFLLEINTLLSDFFVSELTGLQEKCISKSGRSSLLTLVFNEKVSFWENQLLISYLFIEY